MTDASRLIVEPIGYIRTAMRTKFDAPHQPKDAVTQFNRVELLPGRNFEVALRDLEGFQRIWLIWWFHRNTTWRPAVMPPRGPGKRRGVFATRSPHRPNPIGMTAVQLLRVDGRTLYVGDVDLVDETPILDIKPYIPEVDAFPGSAAGWLDELNAGLVEPARFTVASAPLLDEQAKWLHDEFGIDFLTKAREILGRDPTPHRTRRIINCGNGFRMSCGAWRLYFDVQGDLVTLNYITPGYREAVLHAPDATRVPDRDAQVRFLERWR